MTDSSNYSEAVQRYIDTTPESTFEFDRLDPDEDDPLFDSEHVELDQPE